MTRRAQTINMIVGALLLALVTLAAWWIKFRSEQLPPGLIQANGRIEGDHYTVAGKMPGKIVAVLAAEGDAVTAGQILARMDDAQARARVAQAQAATETLEARVAAAETALAMLKERVPLQIDQAKEATDRARAELSAATASYDQAERDAERFRRLLAQRAVDRQRVERTELTLQVAVANRAAAKAGLARADKQLAEARLGPRQIRTKAQELVALRGELKRARGALAEAESNLDDLLIRAPAQGVVTTRVADVGEVMVAGSPLFDIVDLDRLYLKVYIPERQIGKVRLGLAARIYTDAFPDRPFSATVRNIAARAEFTPKEVQTPDERVKLVYAVKLYLDDNPKHRLTPGLPADAMIRWREDTPWERPRW